MPVDARHPRQRIIAVFQDDSNICVIDGQEMTMEGKAIIKKHGSAVPFKYVAAALRVTDSYSFDPEKRAITFQFRSIGYRWRGWLGKDGVLYTSPPRALQQTMGYDVLWDPQQGRFEILDSFPLTADDLKVDDLHLSMTFDEVIALLGPLPNQSLNGDRLSYPAFTFDRGFLNESVETITVSRDIYATYRGVRVGDSLDKVFALYGRGYSRGTGYGHPDIFEYRFPQDVCNNGYLSFEVDEFNRVKEIVLTGIPAPQYLVTR